MHYESPKDWRVILDIRRDRPKYVFFNEVLGESLDVGAKLLTRDQLYAAASVEPCEPSSMPVGIYIATALGVDWGGRGKEKASDSEDFISNTVMALAGLRGTGHVDITWLHKVPYEVDQSEEAALAVRAAAHANCDWLALDYGGQGNVQEGQLRAHGWPADRMCPFTYTRMSLTKPLVFYNPPVAAGARYSYSLDKARSLLLLYELVKRGIVRLPKSDKYLSDHLRDFLNMYEEAVDSVDGSMRRLVKRMARRHDDVVHAVNFAVMALFHSTNAWPALTSAFLADPLVMDKN